MNVQLTEEIIRSGASDQSYQKGRGIHHGSLMWKRETVNFKIHKSDV